MSTLTLKYTHTHTLYRTLYVTTYGVIWVRLLALQREGIGNFLQDDEDDEFWLGVAAVEIYDPKPYSRWDCPRRGFRVCGGG